MWGGDGMVQRCIDVLAGSEVALAVVPAGTANLFATNLGIPQDIEQAVAIGLRGERRKLDVGRFNGEHFAVMAGAGFDASMIKQADGALKDRLGRVAYVWTGSRNLRAKPFKAKIAVDGAPWYAGEASCILIGNVGQPVRRRRGVRGRAPRRRPARDRRRERGRRRRLGAHAGADGSRARGAVPARAADECEEREGEAEPQSAVRDRRRRPREGQEFTSRFGPGSHRLRPHQASENGAMQSRRLA